ncbi:MAG: intermembrane phospholipid transport protein YdbH family protein [Pseudomonas sp.]
MLLTLTGVAWHHWQRLLEQQGIRQLDWQGLELSLTGISVRRLTLQQSGPSGVLDLHAEQLAFHWRGTPQHPGSQYLDIQRLQLSWQAGDAPVAQSDAPMDPATLLKTLSWLPRSTRIEQWSAELPCATGRCRLAGALTLQHAGAQVLPIDLQLSLQHHVQHAEVQLHVRGSPAAVRLEVRMQLDGQPRLTLLSSLDSSASGKLWRGQFSLPSQPDAAWPTDWLSEWLTPPAQPWPAPPNGLQLAGDWRMQLPAGPLQLANVLKAEGHLSFSAQLPQPWPVAGLGLIKGDVEVRLNGHGGQWRAQQLQADVHLSQPQGDWLMALPEALRPSGLHLRIQPGSASPPLMTDAQSLPLHLELESQGPLTLSAQAELAVASALPWAVQVHRAEIKVNAAQLHAQPWALRKLAASLQLSGQLNGSEIALSLGQGSQFTLAQATSAQIRLEQLQANLAGLQLQGHWTGDTLTALRLRGPSELRVNSLRHPQLKAQGWRWQGQLEANLEQLQLHGKLTGDSGLAFHLDAVKPSTGALTLKAQLQEIFLRAGNPLASTLAEWPPLLSLNQGRLRADATLRLPDTQIPRLDLNLSLQGLAGIYDRTVLSGLDGQLQLLLRGDRLHLKVPTLQLQQANPGVPIGPLLLQADYSAAVAQPSHGQLELRQAQSAFLGGRLWLKPATWDLSRDTLRLPMQLQGLELEQLFRIYPTEGLTGRGVIDGQLPLQLSPTGISIHQGSLSARAPGGSLQFHSERIRALGRANPGMQLVADALEDFQYQRLSSQVSYDEQGKLLLALRLEGQNPAIENGRPIHFSINLQEDIPTLLASLQLSDKVSDLIKRRVQERLRQSKAVP